jgi:hypothetical protein
MPREETVSLRLHPQRAGRAGVVNRERKRLPDAVMHDSTGHEVSGDLNWLIN